MKIYLTAIIKSKPEFLSEVKSTLENMVVHSRKETACIQYDLHQSLDDENIFTFYEIWENKESLNEHNQQPYIKDFENSVSEKLQEKPLIYITQKI